MPALKMGGKGKGAGPVSRSVSLFAKGVHGYDVDPETAIGGGATYHAKKQVETAAPPVKQASRTARGAGAGF